MQKTIKYILASGLLLSTVTMVTPAHAETLTQAQINAVVSLLQSFGADSDTVGDVQSSLGGGDTLPPESNQNQMMQVPPPPPQNGGMPPQQNGAGGSMQGMQMQMYGSNTPPPGGMMSPSSQGMQLRPMNQNGMQSSSTMMLPPRPMDGTRPSTTQMMQGMNDPMHPSPQCVPLTKNLKLGSRGDEVKRLQQMLASTTNFQAGVTGYFGPRTAQAVSQFQVQNNISSSGTGAVGPLTRQFFERSCRPVMNVNQGQTTMPIQHSTTSQPVQ